MSCCAAMSGLFECEHPATWRRIEGKYWDVVEAKSNNEKPGKLLQLDKWYQEELPVIISNRCEKHVTLAEVVKLMEWKLTRGKFRPRLQQLVSSNSEDAVDKCSRKAFSLLPDVAAAIAKLKESAALAAAAPDQAAFMSDEALESVPGLKPIRYTAKHYSLYQNKMVAMTNRLNKVDPRPDWTPQRLERCLWALSIAKQQQLPFLDDLDVKGGGGVVVVVEEHVDADHRASKKNLKRDERNVNCSGT